MRIGSEKNIKIAKNVTEAIFDVLLSRRKAVASAFVNTKYIQTNINKVKSWNIFCGIEM